LLAAPTLQACALTLDDGRKETADRSQSQVHATVGDGDDVDLPVGEASPDAGPLDTESSVRGDVPVEACEAERPLILVEVLGRLGSSGHEKRRADREDQRGDTLDEEEDPPLRNSAILDRGNTKRDETAESARKRSGRDKQTDPLGEVVFGVPQREVEGHGLPEERLADTDKQAAHEQTGPVERRRLACGGDRPDERARGDRVGRVDLLGHERAGDLQIVSRRTTDRKVKPGVSGDQATSGMDHSQRRQCR
jgi:hypothetical protein